MYRGRLAEGPDGIGLRAGMMRTGGHMSATSMPPSAKPCPDVTHNYGNSPGLRPFPILAGSARLVVDVVVLRQCQPQDGSEGQGERHHHAGNTITKPLLDDVTAQESPEGTEYQL